MTPILASAGIEARKALEVALTEIWPTPPASLLSEPPKKLATPEAKVYDDVVEYLKSEKKVSEEGIELVTGMMPVFASDFVAYEDMTASLLDEDADLQETNQDLELIGLIGVQNWLVQKLTGAGTVTA